MCKFIYKKHHYLLVVAFWLSFSSASFSQVIDNAFNLYTSAGVGSPMGNYYVTKGDFQTPALFANFKSLSSASISADYQVRSDLNAGAGLHYHRFSSWDYTDSEKFKGASISMLSFRPSIGINTKFSKSGTFNRIKFLLKVSPVLSYTKMHFANPLFMIVSRTQKEVTVPKLSKPNEWLLGFSSSLSMNYIVNNHFGLFAQYYYDYLAGNSAYYADPKAGSTGIQIGAFLRFAHDKRYFY